MKGPAFAAYLQHETQSTHPSWIPGSDPAVEFYDGTVRIYDQRGESCTIRRPLSRQLRALATQLGLIADEIDRRRFGE